MNDMRWASIDAFAEQNRDNILRDITRLVAVPSVEGTPEPGARSVPAPALHWTRRWRSPGSWALTPSMPMATSAGPRPAASPMARSSLAPSPTPMSCPRATAGTPTPTPSACGTAGCWAAAWPTTKAPAFVPVCPEIPERQRRYPQVPRASPAGCQRGNQHARRRLFCRPL